MLILLKGIASLLVRMYGGEGLNLLFRVLPSRYFPNLLHRYGAAVGERVRIRAPLTIHNSAIDKNELYVNLSIGRDVFIGRDCMIDLEAPVCIESYATLSHRVMIVTHTNAGDSPLSGNGIPVSSAPVIIESGAYAGVNVTILEGVRIGEQSAIAAGAVVREDVPARTVVAGMQARIIGELL